MRRFVAAAALMLIIGAAHAEDCILDFGAAALTHATLVPGCTRNSTHR